MNRVVTMIPAKKKVGNLACAEEVPKLRVAAYCRVSTDSDEQATSYEAQVEHYTGFIKNNPQWEFAGIFSDDGISGTYTKKREGFNTMIDECMNGKVDMVITKSISRFARNTLDCLKYIRMLKEKNIPVFFEKENINTMDSKGEVLLTIMASLAQQESQSLSQNVRMGIQYRYQKGQVQVTHTKFLGYTKNSEGQLVIEPKEAEVIKRIYREFLDGASLRDICKGLEADGILTGAKKKIWRPEAIRKIIMNEKYMGDALLQKTYTVDFLNKVRVKNNGQVPQYYVENSHEAIIPKDLFLRAQEELERRANMTAGKNLKKRLYSSKYALSSIVTCSNCGDIYRRIKYKNRGKDYAVWRCCNRVEHGPTACDAPSIHEEELQRLVVRAINQTLAKKTSVKEVIEENVRKVLAVGMRTNNGELESQLKELQRKLLTLKDSDEEYNQTIDEIYRIRDLMQSQKSEVAEQKGKLQRIDEMKEFLEEQTDTIEQFDDGLTRKLIKEITLYDTYCIVEFKSGNTIKVPR